MVTLAHQGAGVSTHLTFLEVSSQLWSTRSHFIPGQSPLLALKTLALASWNLHPLHAECCWDIQRAEAGTQITQDLPLIFQAAVTCWLQQRRQLRGS